MPSNDEDKKEKNRQFAKAWCEGIAKLGDKEAVKKFLNALHGKKELTNKYLREKDRGEHENE